VAWTARENYPAMIPKVSMLTKISVGRGRCYWSCLMHDGNKGSAFYTAVLEACLSLPNIDINRLRIYRRSPVPLIWNISGKNWRGGIIILRLNPTGSQCNFWCGIMDTGEGSRRRESVQRAVNNISQIGGGPSAILSRGLWALFEDFSYQRNWSKLSG